MNKHTTTAPVPSRSLGCLITISLLVAIMLLLGSCTENYSNGEKIGVITQFSRTGVFWKYIEEKSVFTRPDGLNMVEFQEKSFESRRIKYKLIAIHVVQSKRTVTSRPVTNVGINRIAPPCSLADATPTTARFYILWNQLLYLIRGTRIHYLLSPLLSFKATVKKHWQAYNENPGFKPGPLEDGYFYNRHISCLFDGQPLQPVRCTRSKHSA